jgi:ectoine hydroxylase-related dioxygenase (phytanoyl-CoA dioxygenase family)
VVDALWEPLTRVLGAPGAELDPSVFCWVARVRENHVDVTRAGTNFGIPHRDFNSKQSFLASGEPALISAWVPLSPVSATNGCMLVVPRSLDRHFSKRAAFSHMRPALPPDVEGGPMEIRFNLDAARPLAPLQPGSIVTWVGNLIHWGTACSPDAGPPRVSIGLNFLAQGERLQRCATVLSRDDIRSLSLEQRLAMIAGSLLSYSPWYGLDDLIPETLFLTP